MFGFRQQGVRVAALATLCAAAAVPLAGRAQEATPAAGTGTLPDGVTVVASGLTNPRGFTWDDAGNLILALGGTGGSDQVVFDGTPFPFFGGESASIARIVDGCAEPVAAGIPSYLWADTSWIWGAMDVASLDGELYALLGGGGADVDRADFPNGVYQVTDDGELTLVADLSAWFRENPVAFVPWDYGADGSLFDLEAGDGALWVSEAVGGRLIRVTPDGAISLVADLSEDHMVPTGLALAPDGGTFVNHETVVPFPDGLATVIHVAADGTVTDAWTGLTAGTDLALGPDGVLYAAEMATGNTDTAPYLRPGTGRIVKQTGADTQEAVVIDAAYPVYIGFGPDDALYLTYPAFGPDAGEGQGALLRIDLDGELPVSLAELDQGALAPTCGAASAGPDVATAGVGAVTIAGFQFAPAPLSVPVGTAVTWTNADLAPHTVTAADGGFASARLDEGASFAYTFSTPGNYDYFCAFHPGMRGSVVVE